MIDTTSDNILELADRNIRSFRQWLFRNDLPAHDVLEATQLGVENAEVLRALMVERDQLRQELESFNSMEKDARQTLIDLRDALAAERRRVSDTQAELVFTKQKFEHCKELLRAAIRRIQNPNSMTILQKKQWQTESRRLLNMQEVQADG